MPTNTETTKDLMTGEVSTALGNTNARAEVGKVFRDTYVIDKAAADATHATATAAGALPPVSARFAGLVRVAYMNWNAAGTGTPDGTNNATLTLKAYPAAGVTGVTVATLLVNAAITAFTRQAMTLATTAANLSVVDGACFSLEIAKGGTGFTLPISSCEFEVERT